MEENNNKNGIKDPCVYLCCPCLTAFVTCEYCLKWFVLCLCCCLKDSKVENEN